MPLDVQWFIYALVSNGALTGEDARQLYADLGPETDLAAFAQAVLISWSPIFRRRMPNPC